MFYFGLYMFPEMLFNSEIKMWEKEKKKKKTNKNKIKKYLEAML